MPGEVVDVALVNEVAAQAIAGPTMEVDGKCSPFSWPIGKRPPGVPQTFDFPWFFMGFGSTTRLEMPCEPRRKYELRGGRV